MIAAPLAFRRDEAGFLTPQPAFNWFASGEGVAYRLWDGLPVMISIDGTDGKPTYYRLDEVPADAIPPAAILAEPITSAVARCWLPVTWDNELYVAGVQALANAGRPLEFGQYALCGPGINGDPEGFDQVIMVHEQTIPYLLCPRKLDEVIWFMAEHPCMGILWEYRGQRCQLTRADVGLPWPCPRST